ncbi:MAG: hypothetical protein OXU45_01620, partial [Candidatus Melainabacteria bacterium]|nr:hypothetical protein [Candidatus Melainabacteria bacterium]
KKIMLVNLGHNGPNEGWWKGFFEAINNDLAEFNINLHLGTPFADDEGNITYPMPESPEGFTHAAADRMDQAIDGLPKLSKEISKAPGMDIFDVQDNLLGTCQTWTLGQVRALKEYIPKLMDKFPEMGEVEKLQKTNFMERLVDRVSGQILRFRDYIKSRLKWSSDEKNGELIEFTHADDMVEKLAKDADGNYSHHISLHQPQDTEDFLGRSSARFLTRVVQGFNESERYKQTA